MGRRVCIIGGGISGLTAAYLLKKKGIDVTLFEASPQVGGNIQSERKDGYLIEHGPNSLLRSSRLVDLIEDLELREDVLPAADSAKKRFVLIDGKLQPLPTGLMSFIFGSFFSLPAKFKLLKDPLVRTKSRQDESVASFFERRLGREVVEKAADPFISGIFAGDPEKLSIRESFPTLFDYEQKYGSLFLGAIRSKSEKADPTFPRTFTFQNGLRTLIGTLLERLGDSVRTSTAITRIERNEKEFSVTAGNSESEAFDLVIISTKADAAAELISNIAADLGGRLRDIYYAPVTVVRSGYSRSAVGHKADGFGFLVPRSANRKILGSIWTSSVFPDRAPQNMHLFTTFVGGARTPELSDLSDEETNDLVHAELASIMNISERATFKSLTRWKKAIPQYNIGYKNTVESIERFAAANPGIFFCSNFYRGISVGDCVKNAYRTAEDVAEFIRSN